jgi:hypothetical protein
LHFVDPVLKNFGDTIRGALNSMYRQTAMRLADHGLTHELAEQALAEINDVRRNISLDFYFMWARKRM